MAVFIIPKPTAGNHALAANYAAQMGFLASSATGTLVVNQLAASVTPNSASKVYGAPDPVFSGVLTGFLPADGVTATYARTPGETVPASPYTISATLAPAAVLSNYAITYNTAPFTITQAALTITASNATRAFGAVNPAFAATYAGFVNGDTPAALTGTLACVTTATAASPPGTYPITCSGQSSTNYVITYVAGTLTITQTALTITANNATLAFGAASPVFTAAYAGFANGDTPAALTGTLVCVSTANATSPPGTYPITCSGQTSTNYVITYVPGTLTITRAALTISANSAARVAGAPNPVFTARYAGFVNGDTPAALTGTLVCATTQPSSARQGKSVSLTGNTLQPTVGVSPTAIAFANQAINTTSTPRAITVTNTGTLPVVFSSVALGGNNTTSFVLSNGCPIGGAGLVAGGNCTINVSFRPNRRAARSASVMVRDNATGSPQRVTLTGTGF